MSPLVQRTAVSVPLRFARRVAARWRRLPGADPSRFVRDRLGGRFGPVDVGLSAPERVYAWARFGGRALSFAWHLQVGLSVVVQPVLRGPAALASLLLARSEHVLVRETGRPSTGAPGIARSFAAPGIRGLFVAGGTTAAGSLAEARLAGALLPTAMPTLVPGCAACCRPLLSPPPPVRTRQLLAAEARVGSARRAAGPAPSPSWLSPPSGRGGRHCASAATGPPDRADDRQPVSTMLVAAGPVSPRRACRALAARRRCPHAFAARGLADAQARLVPLPPELAGRLPDPPAAAIADRGTRRDRSAACPGRVRRGRTRPRGTPVCATARRRLGPSRTVVRPADGDHVTLPYVFSPPARSLGGAAVVEPQVVEQQVVAVVRREVHGDGTAAAVKLLAG